MVAPLLDGDGVEIARTATDDDGLYGFADLSPGTYRVRFADLRELGFFLTAQNAGDDDAVDSDADPVTRRAGPVTVVAG